jgi:site-specific recombinase XerD
MEGWTMARMKRHPGTIEKRGRALRVILYAGGKRHTFTLPTTDRREAVEFARRKHAELERLVERERHGLPGSMTVAALFDKFEKERLPLLTASTRRTYAISLALFRAFFVEGLKNLRVDQIRPGHVKDYLNWRRTHSKGRAVASNRTLQKDRATLHSVFSFAEELELREGNPVGRVSVPKADPRDPVILSDEQYEELLAAGAGRPMLRLYVLVLGETGARCESEALYLKWEDVDFEGGFLRIASGRDGHRTKSGKGRWVPMTQRLKQAMRDHFARFRFATYNGTQVPWIFHHERSRRRAEAGERIASLRASFTAAVEEAKLPPDLHQHDLRHRRITTWLAEGANPVHVKEAVGHSDLRTTMAYTHLAREHLHALVSPDRAGPSENLGSA